MDNPRVADQESETAAEEDVRRRIIQLLVQENVDDVDQLLPAQVTRLSQTLREQFPHDPLRTRFVTKFEQRTLQRLADPEAKKAKGTEPSLRLVKPGGTPAPPEAVVQPEPEGAPEPAAAPPPPAECGPTSADLPVGPESAEEPPPQRAAATTVGAAQRSKPVPHGVPAAAPAQEKQDAAHGNGGTSSSPVPPARAANKGKARAAATEPPVGKKTAAAPPAGKGEGDDHDRPLVEKQKRLEKIRRTAKQEVDAEEGHSELTVITASDLPDERIDTVFGGRLFRGSFVPLVGAGEVGKGMGAADLIARFTTGEAFPGDDHAGRTPVTVLACTTEDSLGIVKARLRAAGADLDRVKFIVGPTVIRGGLEVPSAMALDDDAGQLVRLADEHHGQVLWLETTLEHIGDRGGKKHTDTNNEASVRRALEPLRAVCRAGGMFGFGALHPRKGTEGTVDESIAGSVAFRNVARSVLHIFRDPQDDDENPGRLLASSKANYMASRPRTLRFRIDPWEKDPTIGRVVWGIEEQDTLFDPRNVEEIWRQFRKRGQKAKPRKDKRIEVAEKFLMMLLADGAVRPFDEIKRQADAEGLPWENVKTAKVNLGVESVRAAAFPSPVIGWKLGSDL